MAVFLIDPRHDPFVSGDSSKLNDLSLTWGQRLTIAALVITSLLMGFSALSGENETEAYTLFGEVIDRSESGDVFERVYRLQYTYTDHLDETHTIEVSTDAVTYNQHEPGDSISLGYDAGEQDNARPVDPAIDAVEINLSFILLIVLIIGIAWAVYFWLVRPVNINARLEAQGQLLDGRVLRAWPLNVRNDYMVNVSYIFQTPDGDEREGTAIQQRNDLKDESLPSPGAPLKICYVDDKLYRLM